MSALRVVIIVEEHGKQAKVGLNAEWVDGPRRTSQCEDSGQILATIEHARQAILSRIRLVPPAIVKSPAKMEIRDLKLR